MKISKHIFISTLLLCMAAQGSLFSHVCIGSSHTDSTIDWATNCHTQTTDAHDSHQHSLDHQDSNCIDVFISSIAGLRGNPRPDDQFDLTKPVILTPAESDHPFSSNIFTKRKTTFFPAYNDTTLLSIASTVLII